MDEALSTEKDAKKRKLLEKKISKWVKAFLSVQNNVLLHYIEAGRRRFDENSM